MPNKVGITIEPIDELTLVDNKWLDQHGYGSKTTRWRKIKAGKFPAPLDGEGPLKWPLAEIKRHIIKQSKQVAA